MDLFFCYVSTWAAISAPGGEASSEIEPGYSHHLGFSTFQENSVPMLTPPSLVFVCGNLSSLVFLQRQHMLIPEPGQCYCI